MLVASIRDPVVQRVAQSGFPIVLVNRRSNGVAGSVVMNDARGSDVAVEHFVGLGHRRIAHIAGPANLDTGRRRLAGFRDALKRRRLALDEAWIAETDYTEAGGAAAAPRRCSSARARPPDRRLCRQLHVGGRRHPGLQGGGPDQSPTTSPWSSATS